MKSHLQRCLSCRDRNRSGLNGLLWALFAALATGLYPATDLYAEIGSAKDLVAAYEQLAQQTGRENAMLHYARAFQMTDPHVEAVRNQYWQQLDTAFVKGWSAEDAPLVAVFQQWQPALDEVRKGAALNFAEHLTPSPYTPLPSFLGVQTLCKAMLAAGKYRESQGQGGAGMENYLAVMAMSRDLCGKNASLISRLLGISCINFAADAIHSAVASRNVDKAVLQNAAARLTEIDSTLEPTMTVVLAESLEDAALITLSEKIQGLDPQTMEKMKQDKDPRFKDSCKFALTWFRDAAQARADFKERFDVMAPYFGVEPWRRDETSFRSRIGPLDARVKARLPALWSADEPDTRFYVAVTRLRLVLVEIALELHRLDKTSYPATLDALTPAYLPTMPLDPYSGKPFAYKAGADGYQLFGAGPDRTSQNGATLYDPKKGTMSAGDIRF